MNWLSFAIGAIAATMICVLLHMADVGYIEKKNSLALAAQITADNDKCAADQQTTKDANDALEKSSSDMLGKLNAASLQPKTCIYVPAASKAQPATSGAGSGKPNGLSSTWLRRYSIASCKRYYNERIILEKFIDAERKPH